MNSTTPNRQKFFFAVTAYFEKRSHWEIGSIEQIKAIKNIESALGMEWGNNQLYEEIVDNTIDREFLEVEKAIREYYKVHNLNIETDLTLAKLGETLKNIDDVLLQYRDKKLAVTSFIKRYLKEASPENGIPSKH